MKKLIVVACVSALACSIPASASAKVSPEQAEKLGGPEFTPLGGERAGNAEGTIPEWTGGLTDYPSNYKVGTFHPDPFPDDPILFTITRDNLDEHKDKISAGAIAMFEKYPTWAMNVYPSQRTAIYPDWVYAAAKSNAIHAEMIEDDKRPFNYIPKNAYITSPFPFPADGREAMLNHTFRFQGEHYKVFTSQLVVATNGDYLVSEISIERNNNYSYRTATMESIAKDNVRSRLYQFALGPARIAGGVIGGVQTVYPDESDVWTYNPGQRRVRRAPQIAYDNPGTGADGLRFTDMLGGFGGRLDRFDWQLGDKVERYIPYNTYKIHSGDTKYDDIVRKGHVNPDLMRYELHRVWLLESTVRPGTSHAFSRRTFTLDEDSWRVSTVDCFDKRGDLWRYQENWPIIYYEIPMIHQTGEVVYDLHAARYIVMDADNEAVPPDYSFSRENAYYNPATIKGKAKR